MNRTASLFVFAVIGLLATGCGGELPYSVVSVGFNPGSTSLTDVAVDVLIIVEFDIEMTDYQDEIPMLFTLEKVDGTPVTLNSGWSTSRVVWFSPNPELENNTVYVFDVENLNAAGETEFPLTFTTEGTVPAAPTDFTVLGVGTDYITTEWLVPDGVTKYRYSNLQSDFTETFLVSSVTLTGEGKIQYTESSLDDGTSYSLTLRAGNDLDEWSEPHSVGTTTATIPNPPAITTTYVYSHGFAVGATSGSDYVIQANDGSSGWVDITGTLPATETEVLSEYVWSTSVDFPVPVDLDVRAVSGEDTTATKPIAPGLNTIAGMNATWGSGHWLHLHDRGDASSLAAEGWMKIDLVAGTAYTVKTEEDTGSADVLGGSHIRIVDETGAVVVDAIDGSTLLMDDDSGTGSFSQIPTFRVSETKTYYVMVHPDNTSANPLIWLPDLEDFGGTYLYGSIPVL